MLRWIFRFLIVRMMLKRFWWAVPVAMIVARLRGNDETTTHRAGGR